MSRIVSPDCRDNNHQKCPGDALDETNDQITECQCPCHIGDEVGSRIRVWETEDVNLVIWGTHGPHLAYGAAVDCYEANSEVPDGLAAAIFNATCVTKAGIYWVDPAVIDVEAERWPAHMISSLPVKGWTPYMVLSW